MVNPQRLLLANYYAGEAGQGGAPAGLAASAARRLPQNTDPRSPTVSPLESGRGTQQGQRTGWRQLGGDGSRVAGAQGRHTARCQVTDRQGAARPARAGRADGGPDQTPANPAFGKQARQAQHTASTRLARGKAPARRGASAASCCASLSSSISTLRRCMCGRWGGSSKRQLLSATPRSSGSVASVADSCLQGTRPAASSSCCSCVRVLRAAQDARAATPSPHRLHASTSAGSRAWLAAGRSPRGPGTPQLRTPTSLSVRATWSTEAHPDPASGPVAPGSGRAAAA